MRTIHKHNHENMLFCTCEDGPLTDSTGGKNPRAHTKFIFRLFTILKKYLGNQINNIVFVTNLL